MANEPVQAGTAVKIGFGSFDISGYLPEDGVVAKNVYRERDEILDTNGNVRTKIRSGLMEEYQVTLIIESATTLEWAEGDIITITAYGGGSAAYEWQDDVQITLSRGKQLVTGTLRKEDTMTYVDA